MKETGAKALVHLDLWIDPVARDGPEQMACDEALLISAEAPVMRVFLWLRPWVSAGYFTPMETAAAVRPDLPHCRRWTGGGVVVHEGDFTFALTVPRVESLAVARPAESYRQIHLAMAAAVRETGEQPSLAATPAIGASECFAGPVEHDVILRGTKIAGGAQRRTRRGLLHQGSLQGLALNRSSFAGALARQLADEVNLWTAPQGFEHTVAGLTREKYANPDFLRDAAAPATFTAAAAA